MIGAVMVDLLKNNMEIKALLEENNYEEMAIGLRINIMFYSSRNYKEFDGKTLFTEPLVIAKKKNKVVLLYTQKQAELIAEDNKQFKKKSDSQVLCKEFLWVIAGTVITKSSETSSEILGDSKVMCNSCGSRYTLLESMKLLCGHFVHKECLEE